MGKKGSRARTSKTRGTPNKRALMLNATWAGCRPKHARADREQPNGQGLLGVARISIPVYFSYFDFEKYYMKHGLVWGECVQKM